ncbi:hypothetical protein FMN50_00980 [Rhodobacterales bacterium]|nr:hypothetical protein FMN50_00980 [Rhodobacterales bacterium]
MADELDGAVEVVGFHVDFGEIERATACDEGGDGQGDQIPFQALVAFFNAVSEAGEKGCF